MFNRLQVMRQAELQERSFEGVRISIMCLEFGFYLWSSLSLVDLE